VGWEVHLRGGEKLKRNPVSMPVGTEIEIRELFFNTPARKKFLKPDTTELRQILNIFIPYALLYPQKRFALTHNGNSLLDLLPEQDYIRRAAGALNLKAEHIIETERDFPEQGISLRFLLGDINIQRGRKDMQFVFVNMRPVNNYIISYHLNQVYKLIFPKELYPFFAVYIKIPEENVDVNVHPTKREVKIKNEQNLISILRAVCEHSIMTYSKAKLVENVLPEFTPPAQTARKETISTETKIKGEKAPQQQYRFSYSEEDRAAKSAAGIEDDTFKLKLAGAKYVGPCLAKYLLFECEKSLLLIDQHAAHERIGYEKLLQQMEKGRVEVQRLLMPLVVPVSSQEKLIWEEIKERLEVIGLSTTLWDNENIGLHSQPQLIKNPEIALRNLLSEQDTKLLDTDRFARRACRKSVMAGDRVTPEEALYLRDELVRCRDPFTCPHGRPTLIELKDSMLEKQFLRK
jgi:DNA mismatch repair protein MutL